MLKAPKPSGQFSLFYLFTEQECLDWSCDKEHNRNQETYSSFVRPEQAVRLWNFHPLGEKEKFDA